MAFDIFALRDKVVAEYRDYLESFVHILDRKIETHVRADLARGRLWPEAVLALNPSYEPGPSLGELAQAGTIRPETARFFGPALRLYRHQTEAIAIAGRDEPFIVTTGTGSGKSLTYLVPMVDAVFRGEGGGVGVRGLVVYPMNALINSQLTALQRFKAENWPGCPLRFDSYTGQNRNTATRNALLQDPPHILLTNYVMLEYILIRPTERVLLERLTRELGFLAVDELHVYRGRQGADVAMLLRRLRERVQRPGLRCVGTSATIASEGDRAARRAAVAEVGSRLFGITINPENIVDETLERIADVPVPRDAAALAAAVEAPSPAPDLETLVRHPLAAWVEEAFGIGDEEGRLVRRPPRRYVDGLDELARTTGLPRERCDAALKAVLEVGSQVEARRDGPAFAFRLHQFLASGASVYATLEPVPVRTITTDPQFKLPAVQGRPERLLFPLAFCRDCGQELYLAARAGEGTTERFLPRAPQLNAALDEIPGEPCYLTIETGELWSESEDLPDAWYDWRGRNPAVKPGYRPHLPRAVRLRPNGLAGGDEAGSVQVWCQPRPLMLCPRCRASFDLRQESDFGKLVTLSQTGRSTATTILAAAAIDGLQADGSVEPEARKLLSFTDNRQDAALQAGHLNDFVQVVLLRGALVRALDDAGSLTFDQIGRAVFTALALPPERWMREPVASGPGFDRARKDMSDFLDYLALQDLGRGWRVAQPNLEQCGLLQVEYDGLDEVAADHASWAGVPLLGERTPAQRAEILRALLNHLRGALAIDAPLLEDEQRDSLVKRVNAQLREPWRLEVGDQLRGGTTALLPGGRAERDRATIGLGARSAIGRYLRSRRTWGLERDLPAETVEELVLGIVKRLRGHLLVAQLRGAELRGVRIAASALRWRRGDGRVPAPDPIRARSLHQRRLELRPAAPNAFFTQLYARRASRLAGLLAAEHTGQVTTINRMQRENAFREGKLAVLCCSPTMELGVDIRDLSVVHLRNVPPNPANYAQRSGRAGRGGRPALVLAFASDGSGHDRYFFHRETAMIAGAVAPPMIDLNNRDLVLAHLHSVWLGEVGLDLQRSMVEVLDLEAPDLPLLPSIATRIDETRARPGRIAARFNAVAVMLAAAGIKASWLAEDALLEVAREAGSEFDRAFDRWRELYKAAIETRDRARRDGDRPRQTREERRTAERREAEAKRELLLLKNEGSQDESDFYPYRYLASEGFIPGYNFPRLPLRTLIAAAADAETVDRPRFIGLAEFGPGNVIYHEGRRHRVEGLVVPSTGLQERLRRAKFCRACGHAHPGDQSQADLCAFCATRLDGAGADLALALLDQPTSRAMRQMRISSEEEERVREGYQVETYFQAAGEGMERVTLIETGSGEPVIELAMLRQATLWRVNHGWRRARARDGFTLDPRTGRWRSQEPEDDDTGERLRGIKPFVTDTRNLLFVRPVVAEAADDRFMKSLAFALRRAVQLAFQVEEQELAVELIGEGEHRRILLWEAAEGGVGVAERLLEEPARLPGLAGEALHLLHADAETGKPDAAWAERCGGACYECLLSYANQVDHRFLDRFVVLDFLKAMARAKVEPPAGIDDPAGMWERLADRLDPGSSFERAVLDALRAGGYPPPDAAQHCPVDGLAVQVDFYYRRDPVPGICVFVDGPMHDDPRRSRKDEQTRQALAERGFRVVTIRHDRPLADQLIVLR